MDKRADRDIWIGAMVVLAGVVMFALTSLQERRAAQSDQSGYMVSAKFNRADGIGIGSDVRLGGVSVGKVVSQKLATDFRADLGIRISNPLPLSVDTAAAIRTDGLLGAKYVELKPGGEDAILKNGSEITFTEDAMVLEELIEMIINQAKAKRGFAGRDLPSVTN